MVPPRPCKIWPKMKMPRLDWMATASIPASDVVEVEPVEVGCAYIYKSVSVLNVIMIQLRGLNFMSIENKENCFWCMCKTSNKEI